MDLFDLIPWLFFGGFFAVFGGIIVVLVMQILAPIRRREAMAKWAAAQGLSFADSDDSLFRIDFAMFSGRDARKCQNVAAGTWRGLDVRVADFSYRSGRNRNERRHELSVVVVPIDAVVPRVRIERENALTRLADHLGLHDVTFESAEFNRCFDVYGDKEFAFKLLDARMMEWLLAVGGRHCYEIGGSWLLVHSTRLPTTELASLLFAAKGFLDRVPRLVWADYGKAGA